MACTFFHPIIIDCRFNTGDQEHMTMAANYPITNFKSRHFLIRSDSADLLHRPAHLLCWKISPRMWSG